LKINLDEKKNKEDIDWAFQSHNWIFKSPGIYVCDSCGEENLDSEPLNFDNVNICPRNPFIVKFLKGVTKINKPF